MISCGAFLTINITIALRHGGATHDCTNGVDPSVVQRRGQWKEKRNVASYEQPGPHLQSLASLNGSLVVGAANVQADICSKLVKNIRCVWRIHAAA